MYNAVGILKLTIQKLIILGGWSVNGLLYTRAADGNPKADVWRCGPVSVQERRRTAGDEGVYQHISHSGEGGVLVIAIVPLQHVHGGILVANNDPLQIGIVAEQAVRQRVPQSL